MRSHRVSEISVVSGSILFAGASALALAALLAGALLIGSSHRASAKPEFSQQTSLPCGQCHSNPAGGGKLKAFGDKFKANGYKVK